MRRMDRYREQDSMKESRTSKNQELYQNINSNVVYTNISDVVNANAFEINQNDMNSTHQTREAYQRMRQYQDVEPVPRVKKELDDFNQAYSKRENKVYDINSVLEEARKNRNGKDALDEKRKLKNNAYNILEGVNREELEKYREEKRKRIMTPEEEEMRELIDTIASKTLAGEIDQETGVNLLSDLMATNMLDKVDPQKSIKEDIEEKVEEDTPLEKSDEKEEMEDKKVVEDTINEEDSQDNDEKVEETEEVSSKKELKKELEKDFENKDNDFYTRSMDLSEKDFNLSDEFVEKKLPLPIRIFIILVFIALIVLAGYFLYKRFM